MAKRKKDPVIYTKVCTRCGKVFEAKYHGTRYCSGKCRAEQEKEADQARKKRKCTIMKTCEYCGKIFWTYSEKIRFCSKSCSAMSREMLYGKPCKQPREKDTVQIKITKVIDVFSHLRPAVGAVYDAEYYKGYGAAFCIIRSIGKYGLLVRGDEYAVLQEVSV